MKTRTIRKVLNDFCQKLEEVKQDKDNTYEFIESNDIIMIVKNSLGNFEDYVAKVSKTDRYYSFSITSDENLTSSALQLFIKAVQDYSLTPKAEREDEKRWYIRLTEEKAGYLNENKDAGNYFLYFKEENELDGYKTKFTRSEIKDWAGTNSDEIIDWIIDKFGEEVE